MLTQNYSNEILFIKVGPSEHRKRIQMREFSEKNILGKNIFERSNRRNILDFAQR